ncbi:MAG: Hpt domain-containing protein [Deltaproteobacteria bacterium]|nr:Hpt domain-containing protein [Deltaproteobacteria bacterium]
MVVFDDLSRIFDLDDALEKVGGDREILEEILVVFSESYPDQLSELKKAIDKGDAPIVERAAHTIKGSVGIFSSKKALETAFRLETMGHDENLEDAAAIYSKLEQEVEELEAALRATLSES